MVGIEIFKLYLSFIVIRFDRSLVRNFDTSDHRFLSSRSLCSCISIRALLKRVTNISACLFIVACCIDLFCVNDLYDLSKSLFNLFRSLYNSLHSIIIWIWIILYTTEILALPNMSFSLTIVLTWTPEMVLNTIAFCLLEQWINGELSRLYVDIYKFSNS